MASNKPTIRSIAAAAGVSRGTVDRVINNRAHVSPDVRARVQRIARELGYHMPFGESTGASLRIGVIVPQWEVPYFTEQTRHGIGQAARLLGNREVRLIVEELHSRSTDEYVKCCEALCRQGIQGLVLNAPDNLIMQTQIAQVVEKGIPVTTYNSDLPCLPVCALSGRIKSSADALPAG